MPDTIPTDLAAARAELSTWYDIARLIGSGRMPPNEWPLAKAVLDLIEKHTQLAQARVDALTPIVLPEGAEAIAGTPGLNVAKETAH